MKIKMIKKRQVNEDRCEQTKLAHLDIKVW